MVKSERSSEHYIFVVTDTSTINTLSLIDKVSHRFPIFILPYSPFPNHSYLFTLPYLPSPHPLTPPFPRVIDFVEALFPEGSSQNSHHV